MYEGDTPNAERRAAALALDRDLLRELLGQEELRELIDPEALEEVEAQLQHRTEAGRAGDRDALQQVLRNARRPDRGGVRRAGRRGLLGRLDAGEAGRRAPRRPGPRSPARSATSPPRTPASTATRSACRRRPACRRASSSRAPDPLVTLVRRYARTHGPFPTAQLGRPLRGRPDAGAARARARRRPRPRRAAARRQRARVVRLRRPAPRAAGEPRPPAARGRGRRPRALRPLPAQLAERRRPPRRRAPAPTACARRSMPLQGVDPDAEGLGAATCCRGGSAPTRRAWLDELCTSGEVVWIGAGARGRNDGRVALYFREDVRLAGPPPANAKLERAEGEAHDAIRERLAAGAGLLARPARRPRPRRSRSCTTALWDLAWSGRGDQRRLLAAARPAPPRGRPRGSARGRRFARRRAAPAGPPSRAAGR